MNRAMIGRGKGSKLAVEVETVCAECGRRSKRWLYQTALKELKEVEPGVYETPDCGACLTWK